MKKVLVAALAVALAAVMAVPAGAFESEFGGYWRTRAYTQQDFSGKDDGADDLQQVDTRTRLYYTAKFSDDLKFVNKFEFNSVWGDDDGGSIGADGEENFLVKNSYVDYTLGNYNFKVGTQGGYLGRGFVMYDDFSGAVVTGTFGDVTVPFYWIKMVEGGEGDDQNDYDMDAYAVSPVFKSGNMTINPFLVYVTSDKTNEDLGYLDPNSYIGKIYEEADEAKFAVNLDDLGLYEIGVNLDVSMNNMNAWFTGIYQGGEVTLASLSSNINDEEVALNEDIDVSAYLAAFGGDMTLDAINVHGQFFYASGNDKSDDDNKSFLDILGAGSYYWAEIMGYGIVDSQVSDNSPADAISNIMAFNLGASMSPMEKLTVGADLWYAMLAEDDIETGEDELGTEIDLSASYALMDNLNLDVVAAYLMAGDATGGGKEDPMQLAAQLSLSF